MANGKLASAYVLVHGFEPNLAAVSGSHRTNSSVSLRLQSYSCPITTGLDQCHSLSLPDISRLILHLWRSSLSACLPSNRIFAFGFVASSGTVSAYVAEYVARNYSVNLAMLNQHCPRRSIQLCCRGHLRES